MAWRGVERSTTGLAGVEPSTCAPLAAVLCCKQRVPAGLLGPLLAAQEVFIDADVLAAAKDAEFTRLLGEDGRRVEASMVAAI